MDRVSQIIQESGFNLLIDQKYHREPGEKYDGFLYRLVLVSEYDPSRYDKQITNAKHQEAKSNRSKRMLGTSSVDESLIAYLEGQDLSRNALINVINRIQGEEHV